MQRSSLLGNVQKHGRKLDSESGIFLVKEDYREFRNETLSIYYDIFPESSSSAGSSATGTTHAKRVKRVEDTNIPPSLPPRGFSGRCTRTSTEQGGMRTAGRGTPIPSWRINRIDCERPPLLFDPRSHCPDPVRIIRIRFFRLAMRIAREGAVDFVGPERTVRSGKLKERGGESVGEGGKRDREQERGRDSREEEIERVCVYTSVSKRTREQKIDRSREQ